MSDKTARKATVQQSLALTADNPPQVEQQADAQLERTPLSSHGSLDAVADSGRAFVPTNREDALLQLGSLGVSHLIACELAVLPVVDGSIAVVRDGIRQSEEALIQGGEEKRFPLLIEVDPAVLTRLPRLVTLSDITGLRFRNQAEADDFRFRPVSEYDTEAFECSSESDLFKLAGEARFEVVTGGDRKISQEAHAADRIVSGIRAMVELGSRAPTCWPFVARFLGGSVSLQPTELGIGLDMATALLLKRESESNRYGDAVFSTFAQSEKLGVRPLIDGIRRKLESLPADEASRHRETRWAEVANDVMRNRRVLDGDQVGDKGAILLRAALLAAVTDEPSALVAFLEAENPAGPLVSTVAAFLLGLKRGLIDTPWKGKSDRFELWSEMLARTQQQLLDGERKLGDDFAIVANEEQQATAFELTYRGVNVARWREVKPPRKMADAPAGTLAAMGCTVVSPGPTDDSWLINIPGGLAVEVTGVAEELPPLLLLSFRIEPTRTLRKASELLVAAGQPGLMWRPVLTESGEGLLRCEISRDSNSSFMQQVVDRLAAAVEAYTLVRKVTRSKGGAKSTSSRSKKAEGTSQKA